MFQRLVFFAFLVAILSSCSGLKKTTQSGADYPDFVWGESAGVRRNEQKPQEVEEVEYQTELNNEIEAEAIDLINFVEEWKGTPYAWGGNTRSGVDCSGFTLQAMRQVFGIDLSGRRAEDFFQQVQIVERFEAQPGDLVFFKIKAKRIDHVGVYLGENKFAHASTSKGVIISSLEEEYYHRRFFKIGRIL
jgi:murein DD-endopeptidase / murein LD-carboxypeptidase